VSPVPGQGDRKLRLQMREQQPTCGENDVCPLPLQVERISVDSVGDLQLQARPANLSSGRLNTDFMDRSIMRALSLDLRVVPTWEAENTERDLWITDLNGERVSYVHHLSDQSEHISTEFTGGYGAEEINLQAAKPGRDRIETNAPPSRPI
jgi:hypothetical protein